METAAYVPLGRASSATRLAPAAATTYASRAMPPVQLTLLDDAAAHSLPAQRRGASFLVAPRELARATGWQLEAEGLCRSGVCVPTRSRPDLVVDGDVDLAVFAALLDRPLAVDVEYATAVLGAPVHERAAAMASLAAPDFTVPDATGRPFTFSSIGRKKKLLVAWASW
jgi:hypothetical protein